MNKVLSRHRFLAMAFLMTATLTAWAQKPVADSVGEQRPVITTSYMIGGGQTRVLDTYLSPEHFSGAGFTLLASRQRQKPGKHWSTLMEHQANMAYVDDRHDKVEEMQGDYTFLWGRLRRWQLLDGQLTLEAGGMGAANIGFIYNTSNGNNPAQARLSIHVMPTATATYRFRVGSRSTAVRYEMQMPLVGLMFSPNYGQSYYEIFSRGDYDRNVVPTTFLSAPTMRHQFMVDIQATRRFTFRIGYLGDYQQAHVNQLKSHIYSSRVMVGFVKRFSIVRHSSL